LKINILMNWLKKCFTGFQGIQWLGGNPPSKGVHSVFHSLCKLHKVSALQLKGEASEQAKKL
jgi:hypothetical protein